MPIQSLARLQNSSLQRLEPLSRREVVSSWPSVAVTRPGKCCVPWRTKRCLGKLCMWCKLTSASRRREIRTETSPICVKACTSMRRSVPSRSMRCRRSNPTWTMRAAATPPRPPPVLHLAHLGLGPAGHTASLVPGDSVLKVTDADVALTGVYQQRRRMTLTYPMLNRSRRILWLVTGSDKVAALARLRDGDASIPAARIKRNQALVLADQAAAAQLKS